MKKTILSFLLLGSSAWVLAQTQPTQNPNARTNPANASPTTNTNVNSNTVTPDPNSTMNNKQLNSQSPERTNNLNATKPENSNTNNNNTNNNVNENNSSENRITNLPTASEEVNTPVTTTTVATVNVPSSIQGSFSAAYPAASDVKWSQSGDWYRARYRENGQIMQISYREDGKSLTMPASPVLRTYVPEEIVSKAIEVYGINIYAIAKTRGQDGQDMYNVTVIENGTAKTEWMNSDGSTVMTPHRVADDQMVSNGKGLRSVETVEVSTTTTVSDEPVTEGTMNTNTENSATLSPETVSSATPEGRLDESQPKDPTDATPDANQEALNNPANDNRVRRETEEGDDVEPSVHPL